jgi:RNA polymerase sigma-70 factor (ECF subfamily)
MNMSPSTSEPSDEFLMRRFQETLSEEPFHDLMRRHGGPAHFVAEGRLGSAALAQDAVQETFIRVVRERSRYDASRPFAPWFYTILRNVCTDLQRKESRYREHLDDLATGGLPPARAPDTGIAFEALRNLSDDEREILILRLINGLSFREIADHLGCSEDAAKKRAQRALRRLREAVQARR